MELIAPKASYEGGESFGVGSSGRGCLSVIIMAKGEDGRGDSLVSTGAFEIVTADVVVAALKI